MQTTSIASLLVGALVLLRTPCPRNRISASRLLLHAAGSAHLSAAEREACASLAEWLETDSLPAFGLPPAPGCLTDWGESRRGALRARQSPVRSLPLPAPIQKGVAA